MSFTEYVGKSLSSSLQIVLEVSDPLTDAHETNKIVVPTTIKVFIMKLCLQCGSEIPKTKLSYNVLKYCSHNCYADSIRGKSKDMSYAAEAAARKRNGCLNRTKENADQWFWSKVKKVESGCWEWQGYRQHGYGMVGKFNGKQETRAHRIAYWLTHGTMPTNMVLHSCDNRCCVNPDHFREGTHLENVQDAVERRRYQYGEKSHSAKLTQAQVAEIRESKEQNKVLAKTYGVHATTIGRIKKNELWN